MDHPSIVIDIRRISVIMMAQFRAAQLSVLLKLPLQVCSYMLSQTERTVLANQVGQLPEICWCM